MIDFHDAACLKQEFTAWYNTLAHERANRSPVQTERAYLHVLEANQLAEGSCSLSLQITARLVLEHLVRLDLALPLGQRQPRRCAAPR